MCSKQVGHSLPQHSSITWAGQWHHMVIAYRHPTTLLGNIRCAMWPISTASTNKGQVNKANRGLGRVPSPHTSQTNKPCAPAAHGPQQQGACALTVHEPYRLILHSNTKPCQPRLGHTYPVPTNSSPWHVSLMRGHGGHQGCKAHPICHHDSHVTTVTQGLGHTCQVCMW